jgi:uncharacterized membrane protein (UPF0127 family)
MPGQAVVTIDGKAWTCQVASTPAELSTGLSNIPGLEPYTGMLFILDADWTTLHINMAQMRFALDILFISSGGEIVGVWKNVAPGLSFETTMPAPGARYFIEVNAGETETLGIGDTADIQITTLPEAPGQSIDWISPLVSFASVIIMGATLVKMGKTMGDAMTGRTKERSALHVLRGERLPQTLPASEKRYQRGADGYPVGADKIMRDAWGPIPDPGQPFWSGKGFVKPVKIYGWQFSPDYNHWRAYVRFPDGTETWTSPMKQTVTAGGERLPQTGRRKPTRNDVEIGTWAERDRMGIWITDKRTGKSVAEWWDKDAQEMFEQGWFKPGDIRHQTITGRAFEESVLDYAEHTGVLKGKESTGRSSPTVIPTTPHPLPKKPDKLEFLPDSMEFLAYTIDDIGYREKIDTAFQEAIARAKRE